MGSDTEKSNDKPTVRFRLFFALAWMFFLLFLLDIGVRVYFSQPDLVLRSEGIGTSSMDYLFEQMEKSKAENKIAWIGASVMQGLKNVPGSKTYPVLITRALKAKGENIDGFNMAIAGCHVGGDYLIMHEAIKRGASLIAIAVHYKGFSGRDNMFKPVMYKESTYYLRDHPNFSNIRQQMLHVQPIEWSHVLIDRTLRRLWALYRYSGMYFPMISKSDKPPIEYFGYIYKVKLGLAGEMITNAANMDFDDRNKEGVWENIPDMFATANAMPYRYSDLTDKNPLWKLLSLMMKEAKESNVLLLFFISPLNKPAIEKYKIFDWPKNAEFSKVIGERIRRGGHQFVDMTSVVPPGGFTDFDHMNLNGQQKLADELEPYVYKALGQVKGLK